MTRLFAAISQWSTLLPKLLARSMEYEAAVSLQISVSILVSDSTFRFANPVSTECLAHHGILLPVARQAYAGVYSLATLNSPFQIKGNTLTGKEVAQAAVQRKVLGRTDSYAVHLVHQPYFVRYLQGQFQVVSRKENRLVRLPAELVKQLHHLYFALGKRRKAVGSSIDDGSFLGERLGYHHLLPFKRRH